MYAIIETGGKQFRVEEGDVLDVELLNDENNVKFDKVLFVHSGKSQIIDQKHLKGCFVQAEIIGESKGPKVMAFKYKRCKNYRLKRGHRQKYTRVKITKIAHPA